MWGNLRIRVRGDVPETCSDLQCIINQVVPHTLFQRKNKEDESNNVYGERDKSVMSDEGIYIVAKVCAATDVGSIVIDHGLSISGIDENRQEKVNTRGSLLRIGKTS